MTQQTITLESVSAQVDALDSKLSEHMRDEEELLSGAFPGGDWRAHRQAHERMIAAADEEQRFWRELRIDLAKKGLWTILAAVLGLLLLGLGSKLGIKVGP